MYICADWRAGKLRSRRGNSELSKYFQSLVIFLTRQFFFESLSNGRNVVGEIMSSLPRGEWITSTIPLSPESRQLEYSNAVYRMCEMDSFIVTGSILYKWLIGACLCCGARASCESHVSTLWAIHRSTLVPICAFLTMSATCLLVTHCLWENEAVQKWTH